LKKKFIEKDCQYRVFDQLGDANCLAIDGTVGYCREDLCPRLAYRQNLINNKDEALSRSTLIKQSNKMLDNNNYKNKLTKQ